MTANAGTLTLTDCVIAVVAVALIVASLAIWPKGAK